ncbi:MAG: BA14K family protein [Hyphomicrobiales bacterium]
MTNTFTKTVIAAFAVATVAMSVNTASANGMNALTNIDKATTVEKVGFFKKNGKFTKRGVATIGVSAAIVGGLLASNASKSRNNVRERREYRVSRQEKHFDWCYSKYRSYDHRSDTYISRRHGETYCESPFN